MSLLSFTTWQFAAAGAVCAAGPLIIHLLNRRRYRVVQWAAMDFLRRAMQQNRKILQIRDLILLIVRTVAVLLFGLALARPYFARRQEQFDERQPLHAILLIDNSLSMAYQTLEGSLLEQAKERARELIERLPAGSRVSILPACSSREALASEPYETKEAAIEALGKVEPVDRAANLLLVASAAQRASEDAPELSKRIVFFTDEQELNWRDLRQSQSLADVPPMQIVSVSSGLWDNTWVADVRLQDGLADVETPATVIVAVAHRGNSPRRDLQVKLSRGDTVLGEKTISLESAPGTREVEFEVSFSTLSELPEPDKPVFVPLRASITPDRLAADDERFVSVPVVAALPVVFVDQYGPDEEDVIRGRIGETRQLRRLLAPRTSRGDAPRQLIHVRHLTPAELTRETLADARLVVVAGLREPGDLTPLVRDYVEQGGQLVIAAGADFDPPAWNDAAWQAGQGLLPLPLKPEPLGKTPEEAGETLQPLSLSYESLAGEDYFSLAGVAEAELKSLYAEPFFFKAVEVDASEETIGQLLKGEEKRLEASLRPGGEGLGEPTPKPRWLVWADPAAASAVETVDSNDPAARTRQVEALLAARTPQVLARFDLPGRPPFLVGRRIGRGQVLFCSTGLSSSWNTLPKTNAMLVFDRILRSLIQSTLPERTIEPTERWTLPLPDNNASTLVTLARPRDPLGQPVDVGYIGPDQRGVTLSGLLERGIYRVAGFRPASGDGSSAAQRAAWEVPLAVNGSSDESDLTALARSQFESLAAATSLRWIAPGEEVSLAGAAIRGQNSWWWLALAVIALLALEMTVIAWPTRASAPAAPVTATFA